MKLLVLAVLVAATGGILVSCKSTGGANAPAGEVQSYQCPSCKETVQWKYFPGKPWITTGKEVVHECPDCKRSWASNLSVTSGCQMCADKHAQCPACKKHS